MGRLLLIEEFERHRDGNGYLNPYWYFTEIDHNSGSGGPWWRKIDIEKDFPHRRGIHWKWFNLDRGYNPNPEHQQLRVDIRRFVERQCLGNAICVNEDMSYEYLYELEEKYRRNSWSDPWRRSKVNHGYLVFYFEEESDAALFALKFAGFVEEISTRNRHHYDIPEEQIEHAEREKWKGERS